MFHLIENRKAEHPFFHERISVHLYTLDELCYFLETHTYLIDRDWLGEELFAWLEKELHYEDLAGKLRHLYRTSKDIFQCAGLILRSSGRYGEQELERIHGLLEAMNGKTSMERQKMRGDLLLGEKKYRQAAYIYMELLQPECARQMTEELRGNIMHNLGVVYARLFLFQEASQMFMQAYQIKKNDQSRQAYLFAMNYIGDDGQLDEQKMDLTLPAVKDALNYMTEVSDLPEYNSERREASRAADAFDWKTKQEELADRWKAEYKKMMA